MGKSEAARAAGISPTLWVTLERGYEVKRGSRFNANPKADTVVRAASAVRLDIDEALRLAGHTRSDITDHDLLAGINLPPTPDLTAVPDDDLLAELARRVKRQPNRHFRTGLSTDVSDEAPRLEAVRDE